MRRQSSPQREDAFIVVCGHDITAKHVSEVDAFEDAERSAKELNDNFAVYQLLGEAQTLITHNTVVY